MSKNPVYVCNLELLAGIFVYVLQLFIDHLELFV